MEELADHCDDLSQETTSMDANSLSARLGMPEELADRAGEELRRRTFAGRHPLLTFVLAPLPAAILLIVGLCVVFALVVNLFGLVVDRIPDSSAAGDGLPAWAATTMQALVWSMRYLPFVAGAVLFCLLARRTVSAAPLVVHRLWACCAGRRSVRGASHASDGRAG